jgi:hypothetical protein
MEQARQEMAGRFAAPDWNFALGTPLTREERHARIWLRYRYQYSALRHQHRSS